MAGAGDLNGTGDEDEGTGRIRSTDINTPVAEKKRKEPEPAASTPVAAASACTRRPAASADMPGAGDPKGPGEEDERKAIQIAGISALESEKKPEPAAPTKVSASCTREAAASIEGLGAVTDLVEREEEQQRKLTEERLAERYTLPVDAFTAGSPSGCALVSSTEGFNQAAQNCRRPFYLMPYLPPEIAVEIQSEMLKRTWVRPLLINPDVLATKVSIMDEINAELRLWDQEGPVRAKDYHHRVASGLVGFRCQMQNRLIFTYAAKGEWDMVQTYLKQLYPEIEVSSDGRVRIEQILTNLKCIYHSIDEGEVDDRTCDLISLLSLEDRTELLYKSWSSAPSEKICLFDKVAAEPSLIGATDKEMSVSALKKLMLDLVSFSVAKGHLAHRTGSCLASRDAIQNLRKDGHVHINGLSRLLEKKTLKFDEITKTINLLKQVATKVGGQGLEAICDDFIESCKQKNDRECAKALPKIEQEYIDICNQLEKISELQDLIRLLESRPNQMNK